MTQAQRDIQIKVKILEQAAQTRNVSKTCRYFGISRCTIYEWKRNLKKRGEAELVNRKPCPQNIPLRTPAHMKRRFYICVSAIISARSVFHGICKDTMKYGYLRAAFTGSSKETV